MADYYYDGTEREQSKRRSLGMLLLDSVMLILTCIGTVSLVLTIAASHIAPSFSWIFPTLGLITPAIFIFCLLIALYWVIRWRWILALILFVPLLIAAPNISYYAKIETSKTYETPSRRGTIKILTYNIRHGHTDSKEQTDKEINKLLEEQRPDIICFQEFISNDKVKIEETPLLKNYNSHIDGELALFTKYKILNSSENIIAPIEGGNGNAFWSDILIGSDTIRVYNLHLQSTTIKADDGDYIRNMGFLSDSLENNSLRSMISRFKNTSIARAPQADTIAYSISQSPYRAIICGDFNDTPNSYTFRTIARGLQDSFREAGVGYTYTYRGFMNLLRIDYILTEKPTSILFYEVIKTNHSSDHLPVITTIKL